MREYKLMPGHLRFGPFELDRANQCLSRDGAEIHLAPRAYAVLVHLVERPGNLITKDELLDAVWGELHVTDGALKRCVADLRKALGDPADVRSISDLVRPGLAGICGVQAAPVFGDLEIEAEKRLLKNLLVEIGGKRHGTSLLDSGQFDQFDLHIGTRGR